MSTLYSTYIFNHTTQQVTFTGLGSLVLENVLLITDVTNNTLIYQFNNPALGGTVSGNTLTLAYNTNTVAFADTDRLQIIVAGQPLSPNAALESGGNLDSIQLLKRMIHSNRAVEMVDAQSRQRVSIDTFNATATLPTVTTVGTVTTVSAIPNMLGWDQHQIGIQLRNAFAQALRTRITG